MAASARPRKLAILGATGSIGRNALRVAAELPDRLEVVALAAGGNVEELAAQVAAFQPGLVSLRDAAAAAALAERLRAAPVARLPRIVHGDAGMRAVATESGADLVLAAVVGIAAIGSIHAVLAAGHDVALANKEALVVAGDVLTATAAGTGAHLLPVDSEHAAIHQCLRGGRADEVERLILTASGGPFLRLPRERQAQITPEEALRHPTWQMGPRVTLDSATLMNKGFEVIEACRLFHVPESRVEVLVHPQSIVHSLVEFRDGSVLAQLGTTDMRTPIQYALTWPDRLATGRMRLNLEQVARLEFEPPDLERFPCLRLAREAMRAGGAATAVLNAADEVAVEAFVAGRLAFPAIPGVIDACLQSWAGLPAANLEELLAADAQARRAAAALIAN